MNDLPDLPFDDWFDLTRDPDAKPEFTVLCADDDFREEAVEAAANALPTHYIATERLDGILERLGKPAAAEAVRQKIPEKLKARSGDFGEILASHYINQETVYDMGIARLRWSDHPEMAMRGEDMLAFNETNENLFILKGESKSRARLNTKTVQEARDGLNKNDGLPSPHALTFVADRLHETGKTALAEKIDDVNLTASIRPDDVCHMLFTLSGNDPTSFLEADLTGYDGDNEQVSVGVRIPDHGAFITDVFECDIHG